MKMRHLPLLVLCLLPGLALAHPGHSESGLMAGLLHPLTGLDHLLAMLAIGIWAAMQPGVTRLALPASFLVLLLTGFLLALTGATLPHVEIGIALSVLLLGLLIASAARLPQVVSLTLAGAFALFHGHAHGNEFTGGVLSFATGLFIASLALHLTGGALGYRLQQRLPAVARALGGAIAASGALMVV